jgi:histidinol-phosphate phosphatase family protein
MAVSAGGRRRAAFLDKDGTLVADVPYNVDPARVRFLPGVDTGVRQLCAAGYLLVVVSNQPGVALGRFHVDALGAVEGTLRERFGAAGARLSGFFFCPHHPAGHVAAYARPCACRKPLPGLLETAARALDIDLSGSWMVGDILDDVEAGRRAGCRTVLVDAGHETEWRWSADRVPDVVVGRFDEAALAIVRGTSAARGAAAGAVHG